MKRHSILTPVLLLTATAALADDHGNSRGSATSVAPTSATQGVLDQGDKDFFRIDLPAAGALTLSSRGNVDTLGRLSDSGGTRLANDNNSGGGKNFEIALDLGPGAYYLMVRGAKGATGSYVLESEFVPSDDHGDSRSEATQVATASSTAGDLERARDVDYFRIPVAEAGLLVVASSGDTDTTGRLVQGDGTELATDDDGGADDNFRIERNVEAGNYYVAVGGFNGTRTGEYTLVVAFTPAPPPGPGQGNLRLSGGSETQGRLEILHNSEWGTVCDDEFDDVDADVACRQLGHASGEFSGNYESGQTPVTRPIWLSELACTGDENRLDECPHDGFGNHNCSHTEDVHIACSNSVGLSVSISPRNNAPVTEGQFAVFTLLRPGPASLQSAALTVAVRISEDGDTISGPPPTSVTFTAGSVSAELWLPTHNDATDEADSTITATVVDGDGYEVGEQASASVVVVDNDDEDESCRVNAVDEINITYFLRNRVVEGNFAHFVLHRSRATNYESQLVVQVRVSETGDTLSRRRPPRTATFMAGRGLTSVKLATNDDRVDEADSTVTVTILEGECYDVGYSDSDRIVVADNDEAAELPEHEEGDLRLSGGSQTQGRLEILHSGEWGTVCDDEFDDVDADVACRQLGHASGQFLGNYESGQTSVTGRTWLAELACTGDESRLDQCPHAGFGNHNCSHSEDVHISCGESDGLPVSVYPTNTARVTEGQTVGFTLLRPGPASSQSAALTVGVVVSEDGHTLSRPPPDYVTFAGGSGILHLWLSTDDDATDEADSTVTVTVVDGDGYEVGESPSATVVVADNDGEGATGAERPEAGDLRLADGSENEGRLEIWRNGEWGTVCDDLFGSREADVACRQLGYASAEAFFGAFEHSFGGAVGPIWLDNLDCTGDETRLDQCRHNKVSNCTHLEDVALTCAAEPDPTLDPPTNTLVDRTSGTHLRFNWDPPAGTAIRSLIYDVCIEAGTTDCVPAARRYARPFHQQGDDRWHFHLFGNPNGGADGLTPGTTYRMCVLARRGDEFSPTVCITGATSGG